MNAITRISLPVLMLTTTMLGATATHAQISIGTNTNAGAGVDLNTGTAIGVNTGINTGVSAGQRNTIGIGTTGNTTLRTNPDGSYIDTNGTLAENTRPLRSIGNINTTSNSTNRTGIGVGPANVKANTKVNSAADIRTGNSSTNIRTGMDGSPAAAVETPDTSKPSITPSVINPSGSVRGNATVGVKSTEIERNASPLSTVDRNKLVR
jgi:hypothetical protein